MKTTLLKQIEQFAECNPKKRGRSVNVENINEKKEASKGNLCEQKRKKDGQILYYRTTKGKVNAKDQKSRQKNRRSQDREKAQSAKKTKSEMRKKETSLKKSLKQDKLIKLASKDKDIIKEIKAGKIKTIKGIQAARESKLVREILSLKAELKKIKLQGNKSVLIEEKSKVDYNKIVPAMEKTFKKLVSHKHLSRILTFSEFYESLRQDFPALSISNFKEVLQKLCDDEIVDLHPLNDRGKLEDNEFYIHTSLGELYYVSWR
uniref:Uncharacterized protein n=1 Tax=viral metagenome TaxID=1070528 RepID=A0A6H1ZG21_9ZZZZ